MLFSEMRTSFDLPDPLFTEAKLKAVREGISLKELFTRALINELKAAPAAAGGPPVYKQLQGTGSEGLAPDDSGFEGYQGPDWHSTFMVNEDSDGTP